MKEKHLESTAFFISAIVCLLIGIIFSSVLFSIAGFFCMGIASYKHYKEKKQKG